MAGTSTSEPPGGRGRTLTWSRWPTVGDRDLGKPDFSLCNLFWQRPGIDLAIRPGVSGSSSYGLCYQGIGGRGLGSCLSDHSSGRRAGVAPLNGGLGLRHAPRVPASSCLHPPSLRTQLICLEVEGGLCRNSQLVARVQGICGDPCDTPPPVLVVRPQRRQVPPLGDFSRDWQDLFTFPEHRAESGAGRKELAFQVERERPQ